MSQFWSWFWTCSLQLFISIHWINSWNGFDSTLNLSTVRHLWVYTESFHESFLNRLWIGSLQVIYEYILNHSISRFWIDSESVHYNWFISIYWIIPWVGFDSTLNRFTAGYLWLFTELFNESVANRLWIGPLEVIYEYLLLYIYEYWIIPWVGSEIFFFQSQDKLCVTLTEKQWLCLITPACHWFFSDHSSSHSALFPAQCSK